MYDNRTAAYEFPKPNLQNMQDEDVPRIAQSLDMIDQVLGNPATENNRGLLPLATETEAKAGTENRKAMTPVTTTVLIKDSLRASVEAASGGKVTILYDDQGNPSYMRRIAPMMIKDLYRQYFPSDAAWNASPFKAVENNVHPAFMRNGVQVKELMIGQFLACKRNNRACSLPGMIPEVNANYDSALPLCKNKGAWWHMMTVYEWGFIQALCLRMKYQPRGNTLYGNSHEAPWETGLRADDGIAGDSTGTLRTKTGTGPASWSHDGTECGIFDLVGNVWDHLTGMKLTDGKVMMPNDNDIDLAEEDWPDTGARYDSTGGTPDGTGNGDSSGIIGAPVLSDAITKYTGVPGTNSMYKEAAILKEDGMRSMTKKANYTPPVCLILAGLAPITHYDGSYTDDALLRGGAWVRNYGTRFPCGGGRFADRTINGLGDMRIDLTRINVDSGVGFRPAFLLT